MQVVTVGIENELWSGKWVDGKYVPADVTELTKKYRKGGGNDAFGVLTTEPGPGSLEIAAQYAYSVQAAIENVRRMDKIIRNEGYDRLYQMKSPFFKDPYIDEEQLKKPRYKALFGAARRELESLGYSEEEVNERLSRMGHLNVKAAMHVALGFGPDTIAIKQIDQRVIFLLVMLNHLGPWFARSYCREYGIDNTGHLGITWGWGDPNRFCRSDIYFKDDECFRRQFQSLKRMMKPVGEADTEFGDWAIDLESNMEWGNPADYKTGYWPHVRPRVEYQSIETRLFPSWPIQYLDQVVSDLVKWVNFLLAVAPRRPYSSLAELKASGTWREICAYKILGKTIPMDYGNKHWYADVFN